MRLKLVNLILQRSHNFIFSLSTRIWTAVSSLLATSLIAKSLAISDFGIWNYLFAFIGIASIFALSGYGGTFNRFGGILLAKKDERMIFSLAMYFYKYKLIAYLVLFPIFFLFLDFDLNIILLCFSIFLITDLNLFFRGAIFQPSLNYKTEFLGVFIGKLIWMLILLYLYIRNEISLNLLLLTVLLSELTISLFFLFICLKNYKIHKVNENNLFFWFTKKDFWKYFIYSYLASLAYFAVDVNIDKVMLNYFHSPKDVGIYSAAVMIPIYVVSFFPSAILTNILSTKLIILVERKIIDLNEAISHYINIGILLYLFIALLFLTSGKFLIKLVFGEKYVPFISIFYIAFFLFSLKSFLYIIAPFIQAKGLAKAYLFTYVSAMINILLNFLLIPHFKVLGAILSTGFSLVIHILLLVIYLNINGVKTKLDLLIFSIFFANVIVLNLGFINFFNKFLIVLFSIIFLLYRTLDSINWFYGKILKEEKSI